MIRKFPLEKALQARVQKDLKKLTTCYFEKLADRSKNGLPDFFVCIDGHFIALELKRDESFDATPLQREILSRIAGAGGRTWVVNPQNWAQIYQILTKLSEGFNV